MNNLFKILVFVLLFVPKVDLLPLPGVSIAIKIEDFIWGIMAVLSLLQTNRLKQPASFIFFMVLLYILITVSFAPTNLLLFGRLLFYGLPILILLRQSERDIKYLVNLTKGYAYIFSIVSVLQISIPFIYFHSGEMYFGASDRASGIFGNAVEFALVSFMLLWVLRFVGRLSPIDYACFAIIGYTTGSRLAFVAIILSGLIIFFRQYFIRSSIIISGLCVALIMFGSLGSATKQDSRFADIDLNELTYAASLVVNQISGKELPKNRIGHYCFAFDDNLSEDQSFAMRLSKLKFVLEYVVLGSHPFGFGMGNCIGDAGDNLFVRILSDGGYPYFILISIFFIVMFFYRTKNINSFEWRSFILIFLGTSLFYDTLYFSRVAPFFFIIILIMYEKNTLKSIN